MRELKCVVMGGKIFNVEVLGENPSIKDGFYVKYEDGGTDTFRSTNILDRPDSQELTTLRQQNAELVEALINQIDCPDAFYSAENKTVTQQSVELIQKIKGQK